MNTYKMLYEKTHKYIKSYERDLTTHDKNWINENPNIPYIHITRDSGTHIIGMENSNEYPKQNEVVPYLFGRANRRHILNAKMDMLDWMKKNGYCIIHYSDGQIVREISIAEAKSILLHYTNALLHQWQKENVYA